MTNWKTTAFGIASIIVYAIGYFYPQYRDFASGLQALLVTGGFLVSKDMNVTGGIVSQPTVPNPPTEFEKK